MQTQCYDDGAVCSRVACCDNHVESWLGLIYVATKAVHHSFVVGSVSVLTRKYNIPSGRGCNKGHRGKWQILQSSETFIIAANLGYDESIGRLKEGFKFGYVRKEDFATALRGHQAAVDATKSPQRELAGKILSTS